VAPGAVSHAAALGPRLDARVESGPRQLGLVRRRGPAWRPFTDFDLTGARVRDGWLVDVSISGYLRNLTVNGVDVTDFVSAERGPAGPSSTSRVRHRPLGVPQSW
jgi:hypothetical protein